MRPLAAVFLVCEQPSRVSISRAPLAAAYVLWCKLLKFLYLYVRRSVVYKLNTESTATQLHSLYVQKLLKVKEL